MPQSIPIPHMPPPDEPPPVDHKLEDSKIMKRLSSIEKIAKKKVKGAVSDRKTRTIVETATRRSKGKLNEDELGKALSSSQVALLYETLQMSRTSPPQREIKSQRLGLMPFSSSPTHTPIGEVKSKAKAQSHHLSIPAITLSSEGLIMSHSFSGCFTGYSSDASLINYLYTNHDPGIYPKLCYSNSSRLRAQVWNKSATVIQCAWRGTSTRNLIRKELAKTKTIVHGDVTDVLGHSTSRKYSIVLLDEEVPSHRFSIRHKRQSIDKTTLVNRNKNHSRRKRIEQKKKKEFRPRSLSLSIAEEDAIIRVYQLTKKDEEPFSLLQLIRWLERRILGTCDGIYQRDSQLTEASIGMVEMLRGSKFDITQALSLDEFVELVNFGLYGVGESNRNQYLDVSERRQIILVSRLILNEGYSRNRSCASSQSSVAGREPKVNAADCAQAIFRYLDEHNQGAINSRSLADKIRRLSNSRIKGKEVKHILSMLNFNVTMEQFVAFVEEEASQGTELYTEIANIFQKICGSTFEFSNSVTSSATGTGKRQYSNTADNTRALCYFNKNKVLDRRDRNENFKPEMFSKSLKGPAAHIAAQYYYRP